jgi:hypothetical protein
MKPVPDPPVNLGRTGALKLEELEAIRQRDAESGPTWFGPAQAARDRRALLGHVARLEQQLLELTKGPR